MASFSAAVAAVALAPGLDAGDDAPGRLDRLGAGHRERLRAVEPEQAALPLQEAHEPVDGAEVPGDHLRPDGP